MRSYNYLISGEGAGAGHYVELLESRLIEFLRVMLTAVPVDELWYLANNSDVATAIASGDLTSARTHFILAGYFENRLPGPIPVDEPWYLKEYPDVAGAIKSGAFANGQEHFERSGFREGRLPSLGWSLFAAAQPVEL